MGARLAPGSSSSGEICWLRSRSNWIGYSCRCSEKIATEGARLAPGSLSSGVDILAPFLVASSGSGERFLGYSVPVICFVRFK